MDISESFQIYLHSAYADSYNNGTLNSNCTFILPTIEIDSQYHIHLSVQSASIPVSYYNINNNNNYIYYITYSGAIGTIRQIYIPIGNYTITQLVTTLNSVLPTISVTYNSQTNKMQLTTTQDSFLISYDPINIVLKSTSLALFGLSNANHYSASKIINSDICCNLSPIRMYCICSNLKTGNMNLCSPLHQNVLCQIPIDVNRYGIVNYVNTNNFKSNLYTNTISNITIMIHDQDSNPIDLNGCNWSMALQLDVVKYVTA